MLNRTHFDEPRFKTLYVTPSYIVRMNFEASPNRERTEKQLANEENLKLAHQHHEISRKTSKRIRTASEWLLMYQKSRGRKSYFVTLTIPASDVIVSDSKFKNVLLRSLLNRMYRRFPSLLYVWRVERHKKGDLHCHMILSESYQFQELKRVWNEILERNGCLASYTERMSRLNYRAYASKYGHHYNFDTKRIKKAYEAGVNSSWKSPNSVDVQKVDNTKSIASYLAKYASKKSKKEEIISGKFWGCSQSLSAIKSIAIPLGHGREKELEWEYFEDSHYVEIHGLSAREKMLIREHFTVFIRPIEDIYLSFLDRIEEHVFKWLDSLVFEEVIN